MRFRPGVERTNSVDRHGRDDVAYHAAVVDETAPTGRGDGFLRKYKQVAFQGHFDDPAEAFRHAETIAATADDLAARGFI